MGVSGIASFEYLLLLLLLGFSYLDTIKLGSCNGNPSIGCIEGERQALLKFKEDITDPSGRLSSWMGENCCSWRGVGCSNRTGRVVKLDLRNPFDFSWSDSHLSYEEYDATYNKLCLGGKINPSLLNLKHLNYLDLSVNDFGGIQIPKFLGSLERLRYLNLSDGSFNGTIPPHLGNLSRLLYLDVSQSPSFSNGELIVDNLQWLSGLSSLKYLDMGGVNILGKTAADWLQPVDMLHSLLELKLQNCYLENLPLALPTINFTSLKVLDLSRNYFNSTIPYWLFNISSLKNLDLSFNFLQGWIPGNLGNLCQLQQLDLSGNFIEGEMNEFVDNLLKCSKNRLKRVEFSYNQISGHIPGSMGNLCKLQQLDLWGNKINGEMNEFVDTLSGCNKNRLKKLSLGGNQLSGNIPTSLGNLCELQQLLLDYNNISGELTGFVDTLSKCNENRLEKIDLTYNKLSGYIPASLGNLTSLKELYLLDNQMGGSIPESIGQLRELVVFHLYNNRLSGHIPTSFGNLSSLKELILSDNQISGTIPQSVGHLLQMLDLRNNQVSGRVPNSLVFCYDSEVDLSSNRLEGPLPLWSNVTHLYLHDNLFSGPIPSNIGEIMPQLTFFDLSYNRLEGPLPLWSNVNELLLSNNLFSGLFPSNIGKIMPNLTSLDLSSNFLEGPLPLWSNVTYLNLANNSLSGSIFSDIGEIMPSLMSLDLSSNHLQGSLQLLSNVSISELYIGNNLFSGSLPSNIGEIMPLLSYLDISSNLLIGGIPSSIGKLRALRLLILSSNRLSGELPRDWKDLQDLQILDLANNNLSGKIPSSIGFLRSLQRLILGNNSLTGEFPSLRNCTYLSSLDIGENKFYGNLPKWIGESFSYLTKFDLRWNAFNGSIPQQFCHLSKLHILDLSHNHLSGFIPSCLGNLSSFIGISSELQQRMITNYNQHMAITKGRELDYYSKTLDQVKCIDLSSNNLSGTIPEGLTNLSGLNILNLSMNHFTGEISESIGNLRWLESLDVSRNNFFGQIPQSISSLTFLNHLNLSYNNSSGRIPFGNQLQTLDDASIYMGNPKLCGPPLTTMCPGDETVQGPTLVNANEENEDGSEMQWFYISIGSGFVLGFGGVCGTLLLSKSWRHTWFRFSFDMMYWLLGIATKAPRLQRRTRFKINHRCG